MRAGRRSCWRGALANAASLSLGETIHIAANEWSSGLFGTTHHLGGTCTVPLAGGSSTLSDGDGSYDVTVRVS